jgi:hypothetical protein
MNYITHLTGFFDRIVPDGDLNPTHISLYIAIFQFWNINRFQNPISINRNEVMRISKIAGKATYHKCIKELHDNGYFKYEPSYNPYKGSLVWLFDFSEETKPYQKKVRTPKKNVTNFEQLVNKHRTADCTSTDTSTEQALVSYINNTNITNNSNIENVANLGELPQIFEIEDSIFKNHIAAEKKEKKLGEKKKSISDSPALLENNQKIGGKVENENSMLSSRAQSREPNPNFDEVQNYFLKQNFPVLEAQKFFNYFSSIGWLVGGKSPMVDWTAAAQNWMLNAEKFKPKNNTPHPDHLHTSNHKNYGEPL